MRKSLLLIMALFLLMGCASDQPDSTQSLTIFGRLSQLIQLGSTEETVAYKLQTDELFITIRGEVLMKNPAALNLFVTDRETGQVRNDVALTIHLCQAMDEQIHYIDTCATFDGPLYEHTLTATIIDGVYRVNDFKWERAGTWAGSLTVGAADSAETETFPFRTDVYPTRPASTNTFELISISLPFIVIALFLAALFMFKGQLMQSVTTTQFATD
ncbi:MAG: hypothetical protein ACPG8W_08960 [Candidatus Promineifilaceae bacterium]